ncbi:MAG: phosphatidylglycerophosphatase A [Wenzhouxiangellaceae bacterium]|nr:phosphatidylglycerophosphatase A [Wenzhouxiangellaceae bacterium]
MNRPTRPSRERVASVAFSGPVGFLAFGLGAGMSPKAPGTAGTVAGLVLGLPLAGLALEWQLAIITAAFAAGVPICTRTSLALGVDDFGGIVIDEIVALWLVLAFVPFHWAWWLAAFALFRFFDIVKPWPVSWLDRRMHGGLGIMIDDVVAGLYALLVLLPVQWLLEGFVAP